MPEGVHVNVALLDAVRVSMSPEIRTERVDTPLGTGFGSTQAAAPIIPRGVEIGEYRAGAAPRVGATEPPLVRKEPESGRPYVKYLGKHVSHGGSVALVSLPIIERLPKR